MSEQATRTPRRTIGEKPLAYFKAVDSLDADAVLAHFADDATLTVQTAHVTFTGAEEIRRESASTSSRNGNRWFIR